MAEQELEDQPETRRGAAPRGKGGGGDKKGARASIQVDSIPLGEDDAADVLAAASGRRGRGGRGGGGEDRAAAQRFAQAIRDPNNKIVATRQQPQALTDGTPLGDTFDLPTHESLTEQEIKRDITEARGGRKWILRVFDENDRIVTSKSMEIQAPAKMDPMMEDMGGGLEEERGMGGGEEGTLTEEELLEERLAKDPEVMKALKEERLDDIKARRAQKQADFAEAEQRRKAALGIEDPIRTNGNGKHKHDDDDPETSKLSKMLEAQLAPMREANKMLKDQLDQANARAADKESKAERRAELEAMTKPLHDAQAATQRSLDALMQKMNTPAPTGPTNDAILAKLDAMKSEIKSDTKDQINAITTSLTEKISTVATTLNTFMAKGNDPATAALIALATGGGKGGAASTDPFHGLERALTVLQSLKGVTASESPTPPDFPSYLVEKVAETTPEVLAFFKEQRGSIPTKEEIEKMMRGAAMKMYEGLDASMKKELQAIRLNGGQPAPQAQQQPQQQVQQQPPPAGQATAGTPAPAPAPSITAFPGGGTPAPTPAAAPDAGAATTPLLTPEALFKTLDAPTRAEYKKRIDWVLEGLLHEMKLGVRAMEWPQKAHENLPRPIVEQFVYVTNDQGIYDIVKPYADPAKLEAIWNYVKPSNAQHEWYQGWLADGINWIKQAEGVELVEPEEEGPPPVLEDR